MSDLRKAAQQAMVALETKGEHHPRVYESIAALRAALAQPDESFCDTHCTWHKHHPDCLMAQPVQVPVAWLRQRDSCLALNDAGLFGDGWSPLYAHPPQRKPLTPEELLALFDSHNVYGSKWVEFARALEKAHGIGDK
jgi:hypothetical protein